MPAQKTEVYQDRGKKWRWRFLSKQKVMAVSAIGYPRRDNAIRALDSVKLRLPGAPLEPFHGNGR